MAEVPLVNNQPRYGVIRWIGQLAELKNKLVAGLELEEEQSGCSDGTFKGKRYFECPPGRGFFVLLKYCRKDSRFELDSPMDTPGRSAKNFGSMDCPSIEGIIPPPPSLPEQSTGMMRGIQGHHNSCYLDSTLYSMFAFTTVFDTLLHRERQSSDLEDYDKVQKVLKEEIVNPLRRNGFVRADRVLRLRRLLDKLGSTSGLTDEEKDPEEFLNTLLHQVLKSESLLQLKSHGRCEESNYYQIITEKDEGIKLATVQTLIEQSFMAADLKLAEVPSCLILQMPRFGNKYKMYDIIFPNTTLDITDILDNVPRPCVLCGEQASTFECKECYEEKIFSIGITSFCRDCCKKVHSHPRRTSHKLTPIIVPREYSQYARRDGPLERYTMELFAVVCIQTSHYVAFVKCGQGPDAPWCFFDSMADRKGESNGYNIPAVRACPEASRWLLAKPDEIIGANRRGELPGNMKRLFGDAYMCMYQNFDTAMYK
ncbi:predicted protein [Nematostella vectensis]|uniref:ubiquitinyl hydrolase 1 n=1 Tax=Nematostella vectensis TaxID=45351 RepID=A7RMM7_NEMVE|nr:predicted protein [Nematostella vectensis]|eukprot:XP_001639358.1 predicted protein [Nematostella vectensis]